MIKILLFEGVDASGKTTLINEVLKLTNEFICVHRFSASQYVFNGEYYENPGKTNLSDCLKIDRCLKNVGIYVYCVADAEIITQRMKDKKEDKQRFKTQNFDLNLMLYDYYFSKTPLKVIIMNTSDSTPVSLAKSIIKQAREI